MQGQATPTRTARQQGPGREPRPSGDVGKGAAVGGLAGLHKARTSQTWGVLHSPPERPWEGPSKSKPKGAAGAAGQGLRCPLCCPASAGSPGPRGPRQGHHLPPASRGSAPMTFSLASRRDYPLLSPWPSAGAGAGPREGPGLVGAGSRLRHNLPWSQEESARCPRRGQTQAVGTAGRQGGLLGGGGALAGIPALGGQDSRG